MRAVSCFQAGRSLLRTAGRGLPGGNSLSFASPKESKQRKGDPAICDPCASLRGNLWCSVQAGSRSTRLRLRQSRSLIRLDLRSSAQTEGVGARNTKPEYLKPQGHTMACPRLSCSSLSWGSVFGIRTAPFWLGRAAQMEAGSGPQLSERSEFCGPPPESSSAGCPQRSEGTQTAGRLFFGDVLLAKQKKVTCRRATPGLHPQQESLPTSTRPHHDPAGAVS